jgi:Tol biopolymer transport system component
MGEPRVPHATDSGRGAGRRRVAALEAAVILLALVPSVTRAQALGSPGLPDPVRPLMQPSRVVRFRVTEGTWISLDVSPSGKTIVFDLLGDLYTLPIAGGKARPLTRGMAFDQEPRFSPDGRHVAFVSDRSGTPNLWVIDRGGENARQLSNLTNTAYDSPLCSPAWSPDGRTILVSQRPAAVRRASDDIVGFGRQWLLAAYDVDSQRMRWVSDTTRGKTLSALGPVFSRQGETVFAAMLLGSAIVADLGIGRDWSIGRVDLQTGIAVPETAPGLGRVAVRPAVSPNGRYLVYASTSGTRLGLRLRNLATFEERWLLRESLDASARPYVDARDIVPGYAFTPDSKAVIIAFDGKIHRVEIATGRSSIIPFVVDVERELGPLTVHQFTLPDTASRTRSVMQPALSPDGNRVAFSALRRVWVMELPDGRPRRLTSDSVGEFYPSWSPDGAWLAYSTWKDGQGGAVCKARVEPGSASVCQRLTTDGAIYFHTAFSPDGKRVVVVRSEAPAKRVLTHNTSGLDPLKSVSVAWVPATGGAPTSLISVSTGGDFRKMVGQTPRLPVEQVYFTTDPERIFVGLTSFAWDGAEGRIELPVADSVTVVRASNDITGVIDPTGSRALLTHAWALSEVSRPVQGNGSSDTLNVEEAQQRPLGAPAGAAHRWGTALAPWISWSRDGRRVLFSQGGTLFVGDVRPGAWTAFFRVDVPLAVPVDIPQGTLLLHGARLITMSAPAVIERGDLVIRNNRILAIGPVGTVRVPAGAQIFDVSGKTILPGYVDIHDHLPLPYGIHPDQCWQCLPRLAYGITALRDPYARQDTYSEIFTFAERERSGDLLAPRIFSTGIPHLRSDRPIRTLDDARAIARPTADYFRAETFKEYDAGATRQARQLISLAAAELGINATIEGPPRQLTAIVDGFSGVEHAFAIPVYDDVLTLTARSGTTHTQTYGVIADGMGYVLRSRTAPWDAARMRRFVPPSERESYGASALYLEVFGHPELGRLRARLSSALGIVARGGRIGMGGHGSAGGIGFHYEMWLHALGGMPSYAILRAATLSGATAIGHAGDFGSLRVGMLADLQVLDRNPLDDIHNTTSVAYVMKNGRLYRADDLAEIWPRCRPLNPLYVSDDAPASMARGAGQCPPPSLERAAAR